MVLQTQQYDIFKNSTIYFSCDVQAEISLLGFLINTKYDAKKKSKEILKSSL